MKNSSARHSVLAAILAVCVLAPIGMVQAQNTSGCTTSGCVVWGTPGGKAPTQPASWAPSIVFTPALSYEVAAIEPEDKIADCIAQASAEANVPDGAMWDNKRYVNGKQEVYRFGRWNPTYDSNDFDVSGNLASAAVAGGATGFFNWMQSNSHRLTFAGIVSSLGGTLISLGYSGMDHFFQFMNSVYTPAEQEIVWQASNAFVACVRGSRE